ncbi:MAG: LCP family protein [Coriobacteriales bacterium]
MSSDEQQRDRNGATGEAAPLGQRIDMAAFASMETSQFVAVAMSSASGEERSPRDPLEPLPVEAYKTAEPAAAEHLAAIAEQAAPVEPEPWDDASSSAEEVAPVTTSPQADVCLAAVGGCGEDDATHAAAEPAAEAAEGAAPYSRESASYQHRRGWAGFSTGKKVAVVVTVVLALALCIGGAALALFWNNTRQAALVDNSIQDALTPVDEVDPYWVLVLGSDSRAESTDRARSDVLMMARVDPNTPAITLVSIPRDTKVHIEGYGTQKINAAYALGGAELAISTVEDYAGIKISHYAEIYFSGLTALVDQLGGVTVNVPEYCSYKGVTLYPGEQELDGKQALTFARCRKTYSMGDFTRTQCQRILLQALVEKVLSQPVSALPGVIESAAKCFSTDIPLEDLVSLAMQLQSKGGAAFYSAMCPSTTGMVDGVSYTFTYINQWKLLMQRASAGENPKLAKKEQEICGYTSTSYEELDMSEPLPEEVQVQLQEYWDKKAAKEAAKQQGELEAQVSAQGDDAGPGTDQSLESAQS